MLMAVKLNTAGRYVAGMDMGNEISTWRFVDQDRGDAVNRVST